MDNFMDKITQKLNSQDMIRANAAADAAELENLENQVTVFKEQSFISSSSPPQVLPLVLRSPP